MDIESFEKLVRSETTAKRYLLKMCWQNYQRFCPRCRHRKVYSLREGRRRCARCGYTFHDFSMRFVNTGNLRATQWLWLLKLFELEVPPRSIAGQLGLSPNTVAKAVRTVRSAILAHSLDVQEIIEAGLGGLVAPSRSKNPDAPLAPRPVVFGLAQHGGIVFVDIVTELTQEAIIHFKTNFHLKTATVAGVVYTDRYRHYDTLVVSAPEILDIPHIRHTDKGLYVDATKGFWSYACMHLKHTKGVSSENFPLYFKELEFRYNNRDNDLFGLLAEYLCGFVPKLA